MLDRYVVGRAARLSPEAPVPVITVDREEDLPGGAGNVVLNFLALGAEVAVLARVGADRGGEVLRAELSKAGANIDGILTDPEHITPVKTRVIANHQHLVRFDHERVAPMCAQQESLLLESLRSCILEYDIVAVSDYGKGCTTPYFVEQLMLHARSAGVPVVIDPKGDDFTKYRGCTLIKPNLSEAYAAARMARHRPITEVARCLLDQTCAEVVMVTRSEEGISLFHSDGQQEDHPVVVRDLRDVTGAGDTVLAVSTYALAQNCSYPQIAALANVAAGIAIESVGCVSVSLEALRSRVAELYPTDTISVCR